MGNQNLFCQNNARTIEQKIIEFIIEMKSQGKGYSAIHNYVSAVLAFYKINDFVLNVSKINKFIPAQKKVKNDRAYTHEEISKLLEIADERMRVIILLMASSGIRVGALPLLRLRNLEEPKLIVYENEREEYYTFITPECKKAIDSYIDMRSRYGEKLESESYLVREQFDTRDQFQIRKPRPLTIDMVKFKMVNFQERLGIKNKQVALTHGFRKFFTTQLINSKVNPEIREMLLGHKIGLASCYYRPTIDEMFNEYEKAIDGLTINEENRLKRKVSKLEIEKYKIDIMSSQIQEIQKKMKIKSQRLV